MENILFNCRIALRGAGRTDKNRNAVIGLVFLKLASDKIEKRRQDIINDKGDIPFFVENKHFYTAENVYYLQPECEGALLSNFYSSLGVEI